jgi:hypothetical protein
MSETSKWYDDNADNPPWIKALAEVRRLAPREGYCYQHVQAIIVSIDQYAEAPWGTGIFPESPVWDWRRTQRQDCLKPRRLRRRGYFWGYKIAPFQNIDGDKAFFAVY